MAIKRGYPNGEYPSTALMSVGSGAKLNERAALVFLRAVYDAKREGVTVRPTPTTKGQPTGLAGYRSSKTQQWLREHPLGPAPIAPVGSSTHGWGDAIDVDMGADWLWKHRSKYGLTRPIKSEPWHFQLNKTLSELKLDPVPSLAANQRQVGGDGVRKRDKPNTASKILATYKPGEIKTFIGYVRGENVNGIPEWFVTGDRAFTHPSGYTDNTVKGLADLTAKMFPAPPPVVVPEPVPEPEQVEPEYPGEPDLPDEPEPPVEPAPEPSTKPAPKISGKAASISVLVVAILGIIVAAWQTLAG